MILSAYVIYLTAHVVLECVVATRWEKILMVTPRSLREPQKSSTLRWLATNIDRSPERITDRFWVQVRTSQYISYTHNNMILLVDLTTPGSYQHQRLSCSWITQSPIRLVTTLNAALLNLVYYSFLLIICLVKIDKQPYKFQIVDLNHRTYCKLIPKWSPQQ